MKSNSVMSCVVAGPVLTWTYSDGKTLAFDTTSAPAEVQAQAAIHGFKQRIADAAAISVNTETGKPATVAEKRAAMEKVVATLATAWTAERTGGGNEGGMLLQALVILKPKQTLDAIKAYIKGLSPVERAALSESKRVKAEIDKIRAARVKAAGIDADKLLDGI